MLNGSVFLRVAVLLIAAAALTGLVRSYFGHDGGLPEVPPAAAPPTPAPAPPAERRAEPAPQPAPPVAREPEPAPKPAPAAPPPGPAATATPAPASSPPPSPPAAAPPVALQPPPEEETQAPSPTESANQAEAGDLVDLNTATVAQLNGLKGGGAIGRAIVQHRPYNSVDQLLSKRVLSRAVFQRIKAQVTVR